VGVASGMLLMQSMLPVGFGEEVKGKREGWRVEVWRGMGHSFHFDTRVWNL